MSINLQTYDDDHFIQLRRWNLILYSFRRTQKMELLQQKKNIIHIIVNYLMPQVLFVSHITSSWKLRQFRKEKNYYFHVTCHHDVNYANAVLKNIQKWETISEYQMKIKKLIKFDFWHLKWYITSLSKLTFYDAWNYY